MRKDLLLVVGKGRGWDLWSLGAECSHLVVSRMGLRHLELLHDVRSRRPIRCQECRCLRRRVGHPRPLVGIRPIGCGAQGDLGHFLTCFWCREGGEVSGRVLLSDQLYTGADRSATHVPGTRYAE